MDYLIKLPEEARYKGDYREGEIEIVTDPQLVSTIMKERLNSSSLANFPRDVARIGIVLEDEYIIVVRDPVKFPSGATGTYLRIFTRSGIDGPVGVVMLPISDGLIYLRKIFRHATRRWELECPRGFRSKGITENEAVKQEIAQELGLNIRTIHNLGSIASDTGLLAGVVRAFFVILEAGDPKPKPEAQEAFGEIVKLTPKQLLEKIRIGEIRDGLTLSAIQLAQANNLLMLT